MKAEEATKYFKETDNFTFKRDMARHEN